VSTDNTRSGPDPKLAVSDGSGTVKFKYRVHSILVKLGGTISGGAIIEAREVGKRNWMPVRIGGVDLVYRVRQTAERHCAWLNDPSGTEPEWGQDESPNATGSATEGRS